MFRYYDKADFGTPTEGEPPTLVLTESPIDALSYAALHQNGSAHGRIISTDGRGPLPTQQIDTTLREQGTVLAAFDNDEGGARLWASVQERYPLQTSGSFTPIMRQEPQTKDWNEDLQQAAQKMQAMQGFSMGR